MRTETAVRPAAECVVPLLALQVDLVWVGVLGRVPVRDRDGNLDLGAGRDGLTAKLDILACEMRWGYIMSLKAYEKEPTWKIHGKVTNPAALSEE